ncbi:hypothetical protein EVAR_86720_1 [Eumeta japonica]|uniref:Uncharacterized protein n=1 Tax=Eumeta variegata TaxID=151549 RepID=A0A4C1ZE43_EUMVA|nr:hypothetical protein EVAR_86720_1 [Eumeta japonica]
MSRVDHKLWKFLNLQVLHQFLPFLKKRLDQKATVPKMKMRQLRRVNVREEEEAAARAARPRPAHPRRASAVTVARAARRAVRAECAPGP